MSDTVGHVFDGKRCIACGKRITRESFRYEPCPRQNGARALVKDGRPSLPPSVEVALATSPELSGLPEGSKAYLRWKHSQV